MVANYEYTSCRCVRCKGEVEDGRRERGGVKNTNEK